MAFAGLRGSGSWGTDERPKNFREFILWANPNGKAPIFALSARMKKDSVDDPEFNWWEETLNTVRVQINAGAGYTTGDTSFTIDDSGLKLVAGDVLQVEKTEVTAYDHELVVVSSVTSDTVIVVKRGQANTTAASIADNANLTKIGNVFQEGSNSADISQRNPAKKNNYCQIFKTALGQTKTAGEIKTRTGDSWTNDKKRRSFDHSAAIEFSILFGKPYEDTGGTFPKRYMGGLRYFLQTNTKIWATTPTASTFLDAVYPVFNYDSDGAGDERIIFCGNGALNSFNKMALTATNSQVHFNRIVDLYGMKLQEWIIPQGRLLIKSHPLLNIHPRYTYSLFVLDPTGIIWRPLRDTKFEDNIQANDADQRKAQWLTEAGIEVRHEETMQYQANFVVP